MTDTLYQAVPLEVVPAHTVRQLPPDTLSMATTRMALSSVATLVELVEGRERNATPSQRVENMLSARAGVGDTAAIAVMASTSTATRSRTSFVPWARVDDGL